MAHNDQAGGSGGGILRSTQLSYDEAGVLYWHRIPVPVQYKLPHGWHVSNGGFAVPPPPPRGPQTRALARQRRSKMTPEERSLPENALDSPSWEQRFDSERAVKLARTDNPSGGRFNTVGRREWWYGRDVDATLREYGYRPRFRGQREPVYFPQAATMAPTPTTQGAPARTAASGTSRTGSSAVGRTRSAAPAPPSGGVVIRDDAARRASSIPVRRTTGSGRRSHVKEEDASPPLPPAKKKWWEKEAEAQAALRGDGDEEEFPAQSLIIGRSVDEDYRHIAIDPRQAAVWSARDHGANFVDLVGPSELPAPKEEKADEEEADDADSWSFETSSGDELDFSAFDSLRR